MVGRRRGIRVSQGEEEDQSKVTGSERGISGENSGGLVIRKSSKSESENPEWRRLPQKLMNPREGNRAGGKTECAPTVVSHEETLGCSRGGAGRS